MKITGIIGFILLLLGDLSLFFTSMNMPAGSKTATTFLVIALITLALSIFYFIASLKEKHKLTLISSILLIVNAIGSFLFSGRWFNADSREFGKAFNVDSAFKSLVIVAVLSIIFGIIGAILVAVEGKKQYNKTSN